MSMSDFLMDEKPITQYLNKDEEWKLYDACSQNSLEAAKEFYDSKNWRYVASSYYIRIDGVTQSKCEKLHHFFKKKF